MVGNLKKITDLFQISHRFFEEEKGKGEGKFLTFDSFFL